MATKEETEAALGYAWSALRSIANDKRISVVTQLQAQRAMDELRTLYPAATEGLES